MKDLSVRNASNIGGFEAAQRLLAVSGLYNVGIQETRGTLSDHYDPRNRTLYLSSGVGRSPSVASLGIVAHEVGHAVQHAENYGPMRLRSAIVPAVQIGSWLGPILFLVGFLLQIPNVPLIGLLLFSSTLCSRCNVARGTEREPKGCCVAQGWPHDQRHRGRRRAVGAVGGCVDLCSGSRAGPIDSSFLRVSAQRLRDRR